MTESNSAPEPSTRSLPSPRRGWYSAWGKRGFDFFGSLALLILFAPVILITGLLVAIKLGRPILFRQRRPGMKGTPFQMLKFRTMIDALDSDGQPLPDEQRLTRFGNFLRASSLDELPGLWNVLFGEMSLVGPRPLLERYLPRYSPEQFRRHEVRPGITGWAQVHGRNAISWDQKFAHDVWYVKNYSLFVDVLVLWKTLGKVFFRKDINAAGHATMPEFMGNESDGES